MKRRDLERRLREHRCVLVREGASHTVYENAAGKRATVPRHAEIKTPTVREICHQLDIPRPAQR